MKEFRGSYVVNITPMTKDCEVDYTGLKDNLDWYIEKGTAGLDVLGSTGEFVSLTKEERIKVAETAVKHVNGRVPVILGTAAPTTKETIEYTRHAKEIGADGVMIISPYYSLPSENEIYEHFKAVSEAVDIPIMMYNNPATCGVDIKPELAVKICGLKNIEYVKEASMELRRIRQIVKLGKGKVKVFNGCEDIALEAFINGAVGWVSVIGNVVPDMSQKLFDLAVENKITEAKALYEKMLPLLTFIEESGKLVQTIKACLNKMGRAAGPCRLPRLPLSPEEDAVLERILKDLDLI